MPKVTGGPLSKMRRARRAAIADIAAREVDLLGRLLDFAEGMLPHAAAERAVLDDVLGSGPMVPFGDVHDGSPWSTRARAQLQAEMLAFLRVLVGTAGDDDGGELPEVTMSITLAPAPAGGDDVVMTIDGTRRDVVWWQTLSLLQRVGLGRVQACPAGRPHQAGVCGRLFLRLGKRRFCSTTCAARAAKRQARAR